MPPESAVTTAATLVIASGNAGKLREFTQLLAGLDRQIEAMPEELEVEETGSTFAEMDKELKGRLGHRGRALELLLPQLAAQLPCNP